ncbi:hypothetical protein KYJ26_16690 [Bacillus sp. MCCB 382]|uniref:hypothetical protein n=1 Tax=Bacillus sp. MCCB 382 TaxID=2860197 RepID=UPI001C5897E4|nr:hypothetical protein [Bacillus sp. MCCB 382]
MTNQERLDRILANLATDYRKLNAKQQEFAIKEIGRVRLELNDLLAEYATDEGIIKRQRLNSLLRDLESIERSVRQTGMVAMEQVVRESSEFATQGAAAGLSQAVGSAAIAGVAFDRIDERTLRYVINRFGDDGLVLSDRVWNLAGDQRDALNKVLRSGIIKGENVTSMIAAVRRVYDNETWKIRRLVVTEGATAQRVGEAYFAQESPVVKAIKIHRGRANRPEHRCTQLELMDKYGLGQGVFKADDPEVFNPHVNCTSWFTYVLKDNINAETKAKPSSNKTVNAKPIEQGKSKAINQVAKDPSILNVKLNQNDGGEDKALKTLLREQGFDGKGNVVSKAELDKFIQNGEREIFRGVTNAKFAEQFKDGDLFAGLGTYGNGTYTAYGQSAEKVAQSYAGKKGDIVRMSLKSDAKVVKYDILLGEMMDYEDMLAEKMAKSTSKKAREAIEAETLLIKDFGRFATMRGYDAIDVTGFEYLVVLNRTSLRIQRESHGGGF